MEYECKGNKIIFDKELSDLDKFVISFVRLLDKTKIKYVIISGYVSIFFGRSRGTEDIDMFIEKLSKEKFLDLWNSAKKDFDCIITSDAEDAYSYLTDGLAIRFAKKGSFEPNIELKFAQYDTDAYSMENALEVVCKGNIFKMSPLEMHIAYKLFMGSEKDMEDALHIYQLFKEHIDKAKLDKLFIKFKIKSSIIERLGD